MPSRSDLIQDFRKKELLNNPATRIWKTMLPVPGSRYAHREDDWNIVSD